MCKTLSENKNFEKIIIILCHENVGGHCRSIYVAGSGSYQFANLLIMKQIKRMIMELVRNRSFILTTGDSKQSRLRRLKNGVPQESVLAPLLFNIYTYDLPSMISKKFAYADDLALLHSSGNWKDLEGT